MTSTDPRGGEPDLSELVSYQLVRGSKCDNRVLGCKMAWSQALTTQEEGARENQLLDAHQEWYDEVSVPPCDGGHLTMTKIAAFDSKCVKGEYPGRISEIRDVE